MLEIQPVRQMDRLFVGN